VFLHYVTKHTNTKIDDDNDTRCTNIVQVIMSSMEYCFFSKYFLRTRLCLVSLEYFLKIILTAVKIVPEKIFFTQQVLSYRFRIIADNELCNCNTNNPSSVTNKLIAASK